MADFELGDDGETYGLVMPFVVCATEGGPYDDAAFVAGWECGSLSARLRFERPPMVALPVHAESMPQVDLIAMDAGYHLVASEPLDGWVNVDLTRIDLFAGNGGIDLGSDDAGER